MAENSDNKSSDKLSSKFYKRACEVLPGGVSRNTVLRLPHPLYAKSGKGFYLTDIEGVTRIDFANNMCSLIHGHAHSDVVNAVQNQLEKGTAFTTATEQELLFAEHLCNRTGSFEQIRFVNSGTEAIMGCIKAARAYTGRPKIAKVEGAYHGQYDYAEVSQTAAPENWGNEHSPSPVPVAHGTPLSALDDVVVIPFNNPSQAVEILDRYAQSLACVLVDPVPHRVGLIPASDSFINALHAWTRRNDSLLIFDEVISYRFSHGGAQEWYTEKPDLTAMGKIIGGGFPVGALAGQKRVMDVMNPLNEKVLFPHSGTFSANPVTMVAGLAAMELFDKEAVERLNSLGSYARQVIQEAITVSGARACVSGAGSMFRVHLKDTVPVNYREAFMTPGENNRLAILLDYLFDNGIMVINTCSGVLSTPMGNKEIDVLGDVILQGLRKVAKV